MTITPTWQYSGRELDGGRVKGRIDAPSEAAVVGRLRSMGVVPTSVKQVGTGTGLNRDIEIGFLDKGVGLKDLAIMARQFATMVSAGISLLQALTILSEQTENKKLAVVLGTVRTDVETGASLSYALQRHAKVFPPLLISLVRAGETGGFLERALQAVAVNYEKEVKLRNAIKSAMTYPVIVLVIAILAIIGMIIFIVPVFQKMFADLGGELPLPTQILVGLSQNMIWIGPLVAIIAVGGAIWWRSHKHDARVREFIDPLRLKLPVFGTLTKKIAIARFTRNFSTMIGAGVPILQALAIVGETSNNSVLEKALARVAESVRTGNSIAGPLATEPIFPTMVTQMISVGEDSGSLETMLNRIADFYDDDVQSTTEQLTALIEPLMIAFLGIVIGGMIVALYLPMFGIISQVQGQ